MKKLKLIALILTIFISNSYSQKTTFLGNYVDLYRGKKAILSFEYEEFYSRGIEEPGRLLEIVPNSSKKKGDPVTIYKSIFFKDLKNDTLVFDNVTYLIENGAYKIPLTSLNGKRKYVLNYSSVLRYEFPFSIIDPIIIPDNFFCSELKYKKDEFKDTETINTGMNGDINFFKTIKENDTFYTMVLSVNANSFLSNKTGVIILFNDGSKIIKPNENISSNITDYPNYYHSIAAISLNNEDILKLSKNGIKGYQLYTENKMFTQFESERYLGLFKCIIK